MTAEVANIDVTDVAVVGEYDTAKFINTMRVSTPADKIKLLNILSEPESLSEHEGVVIPVANVVTAPVNFRNADSGEMVEGVGAYIVDTNGKAYISVSSGIMSAITMFVNVMGFNSSEWPAGVTITPTRKQLGKGKSTWSCRFDMPETKNTK